MNDDGIFTVLILPGTKDDQAETKKKGDSCEKVRVKFCDPGQNRAQIKLMVFESQIRSGAQRLVRSDTEEVFEC